MTFPFDGNCFHPRTKKKKDGKVFCLACWEIIAEKTPKPPESRINVGNGISKKE